MARYRFIKNATWDTHTHTHTHTHILGHAFDRKQFSLFHLITKYMAQNYMIENLCAILYTVLHDRNNDCRLLNTFPRILASQVCCGKLNVKCLLLLL